MRSQPQNGQIAAATKSMPAILMRRKRVHEVFEELASAAPDRVAVLFEDRVITYGQLNVLANQVAHHLIRRGVTHGQSVGHCFERSLDTIVGLLGILKAGCAYVPIDPAYPDMRIAFILRDTAAPLILCHHPTAARIAEVAGRTRVLCLDEHREAIDTEANNNPCIGVLPDDLIYVMYTSGSSGVPKGVLVEHRAVVRLVCDTDYCDFGADQVFLHHSPLTFDASTFEIWGPLLNCGRLAILPPGPPALESLAAAILSHGVTTLWLTSRMLNLMVEQRRDALASLRQLVAGGEALSPSHVRAALAALDEGVVINGYGPTECTTFACCFRMNKDYCPGDTVPIGRPIANTTAYVFDDRLRPVEMGNAGELHIGGPGLARGYLNQPELTRKRFVVDPADPQWRLYKTGDRVRLLADGNLEFLGRLDDQVKIRGHRIEPGEVEAVLRQNPGIRQAVVLARESRTADKLLVAYVVATDPQNFSAGEVKQFLVSRLPGYMVPSQFILLDRLPINLNGKVDRHALPHPDQLELRGALSRSPRTELEERVAELWGRILQRPVGLDENFFDLGGTSLQLLEVHAELNRTFGRKLHITEVFEHGSVRSLAARLSDGIAADPALARAQERAYRQKEAFARLKPQRGNGA